MYRKINGATITVTGPVEISIVFGEEAFHDLIALSIAGLQRALRYARRYRGKSLPINELGIYIQTLELTPIFTTHRFTLDKKSKANIRKLLISIDTVISNSESMTDVQKQELRPNREMMDQMFLKNW
jgi:hypothetical protein